MSYARRQTRVKENVTEILECYPETRSDDKKLLLHYWELADGIDFDGDWKDYFVSSSTSAESITRARRAIQATGLFVDEETQQARTELEAEARDYHRAN